MIGNPLVIGPPALWEGADGWITCSGCGAISQDPPSAFIGGVTEWWCAECVETWHQTGILPNVQIGDNER